MENSTSNDILKEWVKTEVENTSMYLAAVRKLIEAHNAGVSIEGWEDRLALYLKLAQSNITLAQELLQKTQNLRPEAAAEETDELISVLTIATEVKELIGLLPNSVAISDLLLPTSSNNFPQLKVSVPTLADIEANNAARKNAAQREDGRRAALFLKQEGLSGFSPDSMSETEYSDHTRRLASIIEQTLQTPEAQLLLEEPKVFRLYLPTDLYELDSVCPITLDRRGPRI